MDQKDLLQELITEAEAIAVTRQAASRHRDWSAWKARCLAASEDHPGLGELDLGLKLATLGRDIDKLVEYARTLSSVPDPILPASGDPQRSPEERAADDTRFSIFISHKSVNDGDLALHLRERLRTLSNRKIDVYLSEGIPGATDWQDWVENNVRQCSMLLFLHTGEHDDDRWLLYEAGVYRGSRDENLHLVCLKNPNLESPPPQLTRLQAYEASESGVAEFFMDLLYRGAFTDGWRVNPHLRDEDERQFNTTVQSVVDLFVERQVAVDYFRNRMTIGPITNECAENETVSLDGVIVEANDVTKQLLGLPEGDLHWNDLFPQDRGSAEPWLAELSEAIERIRRKRFFNQVLSPFSTMNGRTCYPVISRVERIRQTPTKATVIFVERGPSEPTGEYAEHLARAPQPYLTVVSLLNMARRFRWNILSHYIGLLAGFRAEQLDMSEVCGELWNAIERLEADAAKEGYSDPIHVAAAFPAPYRSTIMGYFSDYAQQREKLRLAVEAADRDGILTALRAMLPLNKRFLLAGVEVYKSLVVQLDPEEIMHEDVFSPSTNP